MPKQNASKAINWDELYTQYATKAFIENDPIQLPWRYKHSSQAEQEFVSFLVCMFAYGGRSKIIETTSNILDTLGPNPLETLLNSTPKQWQKERWFWGFYYRFNTRPDLLFLLSALQASFQKYGTLENLWLKTAAKNNYQESLSFFQKGIIELATLPMPASYGMQFMLAEPQKGSAAKRLNMFMRWVVRADAVDLGLWKKSVSPSDLRIPLDTHISRLSRLHGLTTRKSNDWKTVEEITNYLRKLCPDDPIRYDLAMMGLGTEKTV